MKFAAIHQLVAGFAAGDAISLEAVALRDVCRALGATSEIFVPMENVAEDSKALVRPLEDYRPAPGDLLVFHYSIQSRATEAFRRIARQGLRRFDILWAELSLGVLLAQCPLLEDAFSVCHE